MNAKKCLLCLVLLFTGLLLMDVEAASDPAPLRLYSFGNSMSDNGGGLFRILPALLRAKGIPNEMGKTCQAGEALQGWLYLNRGEIPKWRIAWGGKEDSPEYLEQQARHASKMKGFMDKVFETKWDVIIIQAWHDLDNPVVLEYDKTMEEWGTILKTKQPQAKVILYVTHGVSDAKRAMVYPVADKWGWTVLWSADGVKQAKSVKADIAFTHQGNFHPNCTTMYMISCMLYDFVTGQSPVGLPEVVSIPPSYDFHRESLNKPNMLFEMVLPDGEARIMQEAAAKACAMERERQAKRKMVVPESTDKKP